MSEQSTQAAARLAGTRERLGQTLAFTQRISDISEKHDKHVQNVLNGTEYEETDVLANDEIIQPVPGTLDGAMEMFGMVNTPVAGPVGVAQPDTSALTPEQVTAIAGIVANTLQAQSKNTALDTLRSDAVPQAASVPVSNVTSVPPPRRALVDPPQVAPLAHAPATSAPATPKARRSPLRKANNACAGHVTIEDTTYWYREIPAPLQEWLEAAPERIATQFGLTLEEFEQKNVDQSDPALLKAALQHEEECTDAVLDVCLVDWDVTDETGKPEPLTPENRRDLFHVVKRALLEQILMATVAGMSQAQFFRGGSVRTG
jgi:hypothetical protein